MEVENLPVTAIEVLPSVMTEAEVRQCIEEINSNVNQIRFLLVELESREGYAALGFANMSRLMQSSLFAKARSTLQKELQAGRIERHHLNVPIGTFNESHLRPFATAVYLGSLSGGSQRAMRSSLNAIASMFTDGECDCFTLDWSKIRYRHTAAVRTALKQRLAPTTVNKILVALRRVLKEAYRLDLIEMTDYTKAIDLANLKASGELRGRALDEEIASLIESCLLKRTPLDLRDAATIAILRIGGIRRQELACLKLADLDLGSGSLVVRRGKGGKRRVVYLTAEAL